MTVSWDTPKRIYRFDNASASHEQKLVEDVVPWQTHTASNFWVGVFECFVEKREVQIELKTCLAEELDDCLQRLYKGLKTKKGKTYQRSSSLCARSALQRHLSSLECPLDLRSASFKRSN